MPEDFADLVLKGLPMPALLVDDQERIVSVNAEAERFLGKSALGRLYMLPLRQPALREAIAAALHGGQAARVRHVVPGPSQELVHMVTVSPVVGQDRRAVLCVFEDVTGHEQVEQMRRDFVANVSHELRTPLTALLGFIETLKGAARDDAAARDRFLGIMEREAGRMNRLVRDLLHLSRVESEERMRPTDPVDPMGVVQSALSSLKPLAEAHGVTMELESLAPPALVPADSDQLMQVITNLTENAIKYGGSGRTVTVRLSREVLARGAMLRIDVIDRGEGIAPEHLPRLTERFYRVDAHRSREKGGTGLGLAIVKHIVHRHRGTFRIDSQIGRGSTFTVYFPEQ